MNVEEMKKYFEEYYEYLKEFLEIKRKESIDPNDKKLRKIEKTKQRKNKCS